VLARYSPLLGLKTCGRASERGNEFLELKVLAKVRQLVVCHQTISIFIPSIDGLAEVHWVAQDIRSSIAAPTTQRATLLKSDRRPRL
jgi:hypothetical protein